MLPAKHVSKHVGNIIIMYYLSRGRKEVYQQYTIYVLVYAIYIHI